MATVVVAVGTQPRCTGQRLHCHDIPTRRPPQQPTAAARAMQSLWAPPFSLPTMAVDMDDITTCVAAETTHPAVVPRVVEPLSRDTLTSGTGTFIASESLAFPLTLSLASVEVQMSRPTAAHDAPISAPASAAASPSVFFTLYSPTGAPGAEGSGASTAEGLRGLIWLPIWLSLYSALRYPLELDKSHGMCTVLFVATALCGTGFQVQLWLTGAW